MKKDEQKFFFTAVAFGIGYFAILRPLLKKIGLTQSALINNAELQTTGSPWNEEFWKTAPGGGAAIIKESDVQQRIKKLRDCMGNWFWTDDENCITTQITSLKTQSQVSYLAFKFREKTGITLIKFLKNGESEAPWTGLSTEELENLIKQVNLKPKYK